MGNFCWFRRVVPPFIGGFFFLNMDVINYKVDYVNIIKHKDYYIQ